jgi:hypothetical protein
MTTRIRKSWTKQDINTLIELWETSTPKEIADKIGVSINPLNYMRMQIKKAGLILPKKRLVNHYQSLIKEVLSERKENRIR